MKIALFSVLLAGCTQFDAVEDACHPEGRVPGAEEGTLEASAIDAMNCYRRLSGLGRANVASTIQDALVGHASYVLQNPDAERVFGPDGPTAYLVQDATEPGFTGARAATRFDRAGYVFTDPDAVSVREVLYVAWRGAGLPLNDADGNLLSGGAAMDELLRRADFREVAMQRSWVDGGYTEIELDEDWWGRSGLCDVRADLCDNGPRVPPGFEGRAYYLAVVHTDPPAQRTLLPFSFPKLDQVAVPLFSPSFDLDDADPLTGVGASVQISYPISIFGNASDPETADLAAQNVYGMSFENARVADEDGVRYETRVVLPGDSASGRYPSGINLRRSAAVYIDRPFAPSTTYFFTGELTTNEAIYDVAFSFTTADGDEGLLPDGAF